MGLSRRRFLQATAGAAGVALLPGCGGSPRKRAKGSVVVVGAGLAGLMAGWELDRRGWQVTVVEARDRVGGRVWTLRDAFEGDQYAEMGGEFIDSIHTTMRGLAAHFDLDLGEAQDYEGNGVAYIDGRRTNLETLYDRTSDEVERWDDAVQKLADPIDLADPAASAPELDRRTVTDYLDELDLDPEARALVEWEIVSEGTVEPDELSLLFLCCGYKVTADLPESGVERYRVDGGNDQIPKGLADELGDAVVLEAPATRIAQSATGVVVTAGGDEYRADYAVVAAPLPPLRDVEFTPALPGPVAAAIEELGYGVGAKTLLQYETRFWNDDGESGDTYTDLPIFDTWDETVIEDGDQGILLCYSVGDGGAELGRLTPRARVARCAAEVREVYPSADDLLVASATACWQNERYNRGTYSAWSPGQVTRFWTALRRPAGRIHWAGEHTADFTDYMEGAAHSGRRAAQEIDARGRD